MSDVDTRALIEQAHQIEELTKHPGWAVYTDYLHVFMVPLKKRLLNDSGVDSIEDYKKIVGVLSGVHKALDAPKEVNELADNARKRERGE